MKKLTLLLPILFIVFLFACKDDDAGTLNEILIEAGQTGAVSQAIEDAFENDVIVLKSGIHCENGMITLSKNVKLRGEDGAILVVDTEPIYDFANPTPPDPAIFILDNNDFCVENIEIKPKELIGGVGIFIENSNNGIIKNCIITGHQAGIFIEASNDVNIEDNSIQCSDNNGAIGVWHGLTIINGERSNIIGNSFSECFFGSWLSDVDGTYGGNTVLFNYVGVIPCAVPDSSQFDGGEGGGVLTPRSDLRWSMVEAEGWTIEGNELGSNRWYGCLVFDGANNNTIDNNNFYGNGLEHAYGPNMGADIGLGGVSTFFGFNATAARNNIIKTGNNPNITIKDCGEGNIIEGAYVPIDTSIAKCL